MSDYSINPIDPIYNMLFERRQLKDGLPDIPYKVVASFKGRPNKELKLADPRAVFKKLNITNSFPGETLFHSIENYLNAVKRHPVISQAYGDVKRVNEDGKQGVVVSLNNLDQKNGARYLRMLLIYAFSLKALRKGADLRVQHVGDKLVVYSSRGGRENPKKQPQF
tara:strand:- start:232 stop:729 length:498 start_codon:yes stop_codon:yes gene_type:complete